MSKNLMFILIARMHIRLNKVIEKNGFNLQSIEVLHYSRRLDRVLTHYNRKAGKSCQGLEGETVQESDEFYFLA
jgi:metallophosphoesterase superfamily enzyme